MKNRFEKTWRSKKRGIKIIKKADLSAFFIILIKKLNSIIYSSKNINKNYYEKIP